MFLIVYKGEPASVLSLIDEKIGSGPPVFSVSFAPVYMFISFSLLFCFVAKDFLGDGDFS